MARKRVVDRSRVSKQSQKQLWVCTLSCGHQVERLGIKGGAPTTAACPRCDAADLGRTTHES